MPLRKLPVACLWLAALLASTALGYEGEQHQQLTFLAAKHFNQCVADTDIPRLTPLQVRYMARSNVRQAERNLFSRMFNWRYYDRGGQKSRSLLWLIDTRFHDHFRDVQKRLERSSPAAPPAERYSDLGSLIGYIQLVTSPAHAVPVYTTRWWRFSVSDRFDDYPVDNAAVEAALGDDCDFLAFGALQNN